MGAIVLFSRDFRQLIKSIRGREGEGGKEGEGGRDSIHVQLSECHQCK